MKNTRINLIVLVALSLFLSNVYGGNPKSGSLPSFMTMGSFSKANAVLTAPQGVAGQSTCISAVPIVNATATDTYGSASRYSDNANIIYYDYFSPIGSIANGFTYSGCQQLKDCMYNNEGDYMIMGNNEWTETCDWYNNFEDCESVTKCTGEPVDDQDRMAFALINPLNENSANHGVELSISSVRGNWDFGGYDFDTSLGTNHLPVALQNLTINSIACDSYNCTMEVSIPNITIDPSGNSGGLYGDDEMVTSNLIAGYKIYAIGSEVAPLTGKAADWNMSIVSGQHVSRSITQMTTTTVVVDITSGTGNIYLSYAPVFNYNNACLSTVCNDFEVLNIDVASSGNLVSPYLAPHAGPLQASEIPAESVAIKSFTAKPVQRQINLQWTTTKEQSLRGFYIYRLAAKSGWTLVNSTIVPATGRPAIYSLVDKVMSSQPKSSRYRLDVIGISGAVVAQKETSPNGR